MSDLHAKERRRHLRFTPTNETLSDLIHKSVEATAHIQFDINSSEFKSDMVGFVIEESYSGASLIFLKNNLDASKKLQEGGEHLVKLGPLSPMKAKICWRSDVDELLFKVGLQLLE